MRRTLLALFFVALAACGDDAGSNNVSTSAPPTCDGPKCDGISQTFQDAFDDMRDVDLEDLTIVGAGLATDELNGQLDDIPYAQIELGPTALYGAEEEILGETVVHDLDELRSGLTERLGEDAFATRVTETRAGVAQREGIVWGESYFRIGPDLGHDWSIDAGDVVGSVGFDADASVETVVIAPYEDGFEGVTDAPLAAISQTRGWIIPRDMDDVVAMTPGESLAMTARGALGLNLGAGVPFLIGTAADIVTLQARLSFAARVALSGKLDVQLVRGEGRTAWIDIGVRQQSLRHFSVALTTGFGVSGLPEVDLDLGPVDLDVDDLAEKALRRQLDQRLTPELSASNTNSSLRLTVARFRFDLGTADEAFEQAFAQSLRGDIRLAQALANRDGSGVAQELDITKDARSEGNYIGFRFLGMEFYRSNQFDTGTIQIEADGTNQTLLFSELQQKSGLFFTDRDLGWRKVVSITTEDGRVVDSQVNARLTLREKDRFLTRDQMLDHVDAMAAYFIGHAALFDDVGAQTDALAEFVDTTCGRVTANSSFRERQEHRECLESIPTMPEVEQAETEIVSTYEAILTGGDVRGEFAPGQTQAQEYARRLLAFKLELSKLNDRPDVSLDGPEGQMVTQLRFSDEGLHGMMQGSRSVEFRQALEDSLRVMANRRIADTERRQEHIDDYISDRAERLDELALIFLQAAARFSEFEDISASSLDGEQIGDGTSMVVIDESDPQEIDLATIAEHKGDVMEKLLPEMVDRADDGILRDLDEPGAFVVGYALMRMAEPSQIELLTSFTFEDDDAPEDVQLYSRGDATFIDAGQFNLEKLLAAE